MLSPAASPLPDRIGPYRVVTRLASGGMSEVFLSMRRGVAGFERPVVVKRMLPHLATEPELCGAIVDESRIVSRLRHPNVVAAEDLGLDGPSYYIVLEYLRGESVSGLLRRLRARGERLDPALAALVIAETCAGLHAAHELADDDGAPLGVVHRDVSPHNVLVTFEGEVKVIDFGIARFAHRASARTKTGLAKGKFAYMAPEQFTGEPLDRRADVFSVGALMYELLTGERLFVRESDMQSLKAILHDPIAPPSERWPAIPASLDAVCLRALARPRDERFPTAEALRTAVRDLMPVIDPGQQARERLGALMRRVLADRDAESEELLRRARERSATRPTPLRLERQTAETASVAPAPAPAPSGPATPSAPPSDPEVIVVDDAAPELRPRPARPRRARRSRRLAIGALAAAALAAIGVVSSVWAIRPGEAAHPREPAPHGDAPATAAATPTEPLRAPVDPAPAPIASPPPTVTVHLETIPPGAEVRLGDEIVGITPCLVELPRGATPVELSVARRGYAPEHEIVVPTADVRVRLRLTSARDEPRPPRRSRPRFYSFD